MSLLKVNNIEVIYNDVILVLKGTMPLIFGYIFQVGLS